MPTGFQIGPLTIRYYGIILMLGALAAAWMADYEARRRKQNSELVWDGLIWVLIGGIIGARIWHILTPPPSFIAQGITAQYYLTHPLDAISIWKGGLGLPGAVAGGALALYFYCRSKRISFAMWVDIAAPAVALGQAIGRWGNYVNQELYGLPTNLPWAIHIAPQNRVAPYQNFSTFHPLFFYEFLWNLGNMGLLLWMERRFPRRLKLGDLFLSYLFIYGLGRFLLEFLRVDSSQLFSINANQWLMVVVMVISGAILFLRHRNDEFVDEDEYEDEDEEGELEEETGAMPVENAALIETDTESPEMGETRQPPAAPEQGPDGDVTPPPQTV